MKRLIPILIIAVIFTIPAYLACGDDKTDKLNQESGYTFSPGYINAAKYQAESIRYKANISGEEKEKGIFEAIVDYAKDKLGYRTKEQAADKSAIKPILQQKASGSNPEALTVGSANQLIDSGPSSVRRGAGTDQRDIDGNFASVSGKEMVSEIIDGIRYQYAGFTSDSRDTVQGAVDRAAAGESVIVKNNGVTLSALPLFLRRSMTPTTINITKAINIYGGYDSAGNRSWTTGVYGIMKVEGVNDISSSVRISGFNFLAPVSGSVVNYLVAWAGGIYGGIVVRNSTSVNISRCTLFSVNGLYASNSTVSISNSTIAGAMAGISASNSRVTAANSNINGVGLWGGGTFIILLGGGYGIVGNDTRFSLYDNKISSVTPARNMQLTNNSQISYTAPTIQRFGQNTDISSMSKAANKSPYDSYNNPVISQTASPNPFINNNTGAMLKDLIKGKEGIHVNQAGQIDPELLAKMLEGTLSQAMYLPGAQLSPEDMEAAIKLASILANPTEDQKVVIDSITSLLNDIENLQNHTGTNPELQKASSDLLQMVANVLLSQAIPDLLKEGDLQGIKGIFSQLDSGKSKVILEYKEATKPYYEEVKKLIEKNASVLDIDLNLKNLIKKELKEIPRSDIDKILEKLKAKANKSFEEEYILQQEEKAKAKYIDPNKKKLEENMKKMLEDFTKKLSVTLENKK